MVFGDESAHIEFRVAEVAPANPHTVGGDVRVIARVRHGDFAGENDAWIDRDVWAKFITDLTALEHHRAGEAVLQGISPGELVLRLRAIDRAGHIAINGEMLRYVYPRSADGAQALQLHFSDIEFDPTLLPRLVAELIASR